jgi:4-aminobutyrate aminotransferase
MVGVELARRDTSRTPDQELRNRVVRAAFEKGLLLLGCGESTIRFIPPLIVNKGEVDVAVEIFASTLKELTQ